MNSPLSLTSSATWLGESGWGLMFHYIDKPASSNVASATSSDDWNRRVDAFDVARFARTIKTSGAGYVVFTLGQNTGHYCSPNAVYDGFVGVTPSRLSRRDLIAEIADALAPDVRLIAYLPSHPPSNHADAIKALDFMPPWDASASGLQKTWADAESADERLSSMQHKWEAVVAHWGERWGDRVSGWWIDGCYYAQRMYAGAKEPNFQSFARALRAGNPRRILAFNSGTAKPFERLTTEQDYTAGEFSNKLPVANKWEPLGAQIDGMQTHLLGYLGTWWGEGAPRFSDAFAAAYTQETLARGAALTWDVPIAADGTIADIFLKQFNHIRAHAKSV